MKHILTFSDDLFSINDSMEVESGTELARLDTGEKVVTLEIRGEVRVKYRDIVYKTPAQFPKELQDFFHKADYSSHDIPDADTLDIIDNNWAEVFLWKKGKNGTLNWTGSSDVIDLGGFDNPADIYNFLYETLLAFTQID